MPNSLSSWIGRRHYGFTLLALFMFSELSDRAEEPSAKPPARSDVTATTSNPAGSRSGSDVAYGQAAGVTLKLDYALPEGAGPFPVALLVHGGGWIGGDKKRQMSPLFEPLVQDGFAWFSINYRLAPMHKYPGSVEDSETAIRWVKAHADEYHLDAKRIVIIGESAGAHLVDLAGMRGQPGCDVAGIVSFYGPHDLTGDSGKVSPPITAYFGVTTPDDAARKLLREASPISYLHRGLPPFLLLHGTADRLVDYDQSVKFQAALRANGTSCELITVEGGVHGMTNWDKAHQVYQPKLFVWLDEHFKK